MPLSGTPRIRSFTDFRCGKSPLSGSRSGYKLVNQPTVRDTSTPASPSRPWPSRPSTHSSAPVHWRKARASAASSNSSGRIR